jgi:hypothetical protein
MVYKASKKELIATSNHKIVIADWKGIQKETYHTPDVHMSELYGPVDIALHSDDRYDQLFICDCRGKIHVIQLNAYNAVKV